MIELSAAALAQLRSDRVRISPLIRIDSVPAIRIWGGTGWLDLPADVYDTDGARYFGFAEMRDLPTISVLLNGVADRVEIKLSGISSRVIALTESDAASVKRVEVAFGFAVFDPDWQLLAGPIWMTLYRADYPSISFQPVDDGYQHIISLSIGSLLTGRRRAAYSYWTDSDHQARVPGDKFCERTVRMAQIATKTWPRF
jgi:hypothetical protein